jgi:uncharacterized lipoprotein NlpE involved in copper resistance
MKIGIVFLIFCTIILLGCAAQQQGTETGTKPSGNDFMNIISKKSALSFKADYKLTTKTNQQTTEGKQTWAMTPSKMKIVTEMEQGKSSMYFIDNKVYICTDAQGKTNCMMFSSEESENQNQAFNTNEDIASNPANYDVVQLSTRTIAGTSAKCFKVNLKEADEWTMESCYSSEGVPLYMKYTGTGVESLLEATSYSTSVSDSEFTLPAEPVDISEMMKNIPKTPTD